MSEIVTNTFMKLCYYMILIWTYIQTLIQFFLKQMLFLFNESIVYTYYIDYKGNRKWLMSTNRAKFIVVVFVHDNTIGYYITKDTTKNINLNSITKSNAFQNRYNLKRKIISIYLDDEDISKQIEHVMYCFINMHMTVHDLRIFLRAANKKTLTIVDDDFNEIIFKDRDEITIN